MKSSSLKPDLHRPICCSGLQVYRPEIQSTTHRGFHLNVLCTSAEFCPSS
ncbi:hypothetical protein AHF37_02244 [Paragonimus kellicotti]|nr:hypothetical protein AHF37_02244 [Paragonimus kellicotti]